MMHFENEFDFLVKLAIGLLAVGEIFRVALNSDMPLIFCGIAWVCVALTIGLMWFVDKLGPS